MFLWLIVLGLVVGSFVGVVYYRLPQGLGFVKGRSYCDTCKKKLFWYHNIPVLSFILLKGKSFCCQKPIPPVYLLIEIIVSTAFVFLYLLFGLSIELLIYLSIFVVTLLVFLIDLKHQIIPDQLSLLFVALGLLVVSDKLYINLFISFFSALLLLIIHMVTKGKGMGMGDVKLAIPIAFILGFPTAFYWLVLSFIVGGITASFLLLLKLARMKSKIAFGPFLVLGFWVVTLYSKLVNG